MTRSELRSRRGWLDAVEVPGCGIARPEFGQLVAGGNPCGPAVVGRRAASSCDGFADRYVGLEIVRRKPSGSVTVNPMGPHGSGAGPWSRRIPDWIA